MQSESGAALSEFGGEERIDYLIRDVLCHAGPVVFDLDRLQRRLRLGHLKTDISGPLGKGMFDRFVDEIGDDLSEFPGIAVQLGPLRNFIDDSFDGMADRWLKRQQDAAAPPSGTGSPHPASDTRLTTIAKPTLTDHMANLRPVRADDAIRSNDKESQTNELRAKRLFMHGAALSARISYQRQMIGRRNR
ncbi:hypothetical protein [Nisaea sp.]|uniref:hypothetical protein n=1 Tax=Nisaea sp. TaxID=2024842 RepID=UPI003B5241C9